MLCLALASVCCFSACNVKKPTSSDSSNKKDEDLKETEYNQMDDYLGGKHIFNVNTTSHDLVKNGKTQYKIVISKTRTANISSAVSEFSNFFKEATGADITYVTDDTATYSEDAEYICLGENAYSESAGLEKPEDLKGNGYVIKTVGKSLFVLGGQDIGTLFGAYELLTQLFNYMCYSTDTYYIDTDVTDVKLPDCDIFDNPDIDQRLANYGVIYYDKTLAHKLRFQLQYDEVYLNPGRSFHNTLEYLPPKDYTEHKAYWYNSATDQLCYTAHGNAEEYDALVNAMVDAIKPYVLAEPEKRIITITQEDNHSCCTCPTCKEIEEKYGTIAATNVMFINSVAEKFEEWLNSECPGRDVTIATFAYHRYEQAPAVQNAMGEWEPIDENMVLRDNVTILYAPLSSMSFNHSIDDPANDTTKAILAGWAACSKHVAVWNYQTHFPNYFMPYDTFAVCQDQYKKYLSYGCTWMFDQGQHNNGNSTNFSMLKLYLNSQWGWDVNRDYNTLVDNFFENYYGVKDGAMRKFYEDLRTYLAYLDAEELLGGKTSETGVGASYWPLQLVQQWMGYVDEAYAEIEYLKDVDLDRYNKMHDHITLESLMPRYMLLSYYLSRFTSDEQAQMKESFKADCIKLNLTKLSESSDISKLIGTW